MPDKPQVHYLLGYLRSEEGRYREALPEFQKAVQLDPDYLNAWKEIGETGEEMRLPTALRSEVAINEVRLDPLQRHAEVQAADVTDLAGLWNAVAAGSALAPPPQEPLLPLTASAAMLKNQNSDLADNSISSYNSYSPPPSPSETIGGNRFISAADQIFSALQMSGRP
jgi:tetratricopeptide (TPR) repeat protein